MRDYLQSLIDYVALKIKEGKTLDQIAETNTIPGHNSRIELWEGARKMNLMATAEQLVNKL